MRDSFGGLRALGSCWLPEGSSGRALGRSWESLQVDFMRTEAMASVATETMASVATEAMASVATEEDSSAATEEDSSVATEHILSQQSENPKNVLVHEMGRRKRW